MSNTFLILLTATLGAGFVLILQYVIIPFIVPLVTIP